MKPFSFAVPVACLLLFVLSACLLWNTPARGADELAGRIAFLRKGEVWVTDKEGKGKKQLTKAGGKVENYLFSPTLRYLACTKTIGRVYEPGLVEGEEEGENTRKELYAIVIMDIESGETAAEITPSGGEWIYPEEWLPGDRLLYYSVSGTEVSGFFEYDVPKGSKREIEYGKPSILSKVDFSRDGRLMIYVEDTGQGAERREHLHAVDLDSNEDKILFTLPSIESPRISHDKRYIAFIEVESRDDGLSGVLRVYDRKSGSLERLSAKPEEGSAAVSWSLDDTYIGMWAPPEAVLVKLGDPGDIQTVSGTDFQWISGNAVVFAREGNIYIYDPGKKRSTLFLKGSSKPVFLQKAPKELKAPVPKEEKRI